MVKILDVLIFCAVTTTIIIGFIGVILVGFGDLSTALPIAILFTTVLGLIFAIAVFNFIRKGLNRPLS